MKIMSVLRTALSGHLSAISIDALLQRHVGVQHGEVASMSERDREQVALAIEEAASLFSTTPRKELRRILRTSLGLSNADEPAARSDGSVVTTSIRTEVDVNVARNTARQLAAELGFSSSAAVKVATGVSELARNIILYAGEGTVEIQALDRGGAEPKLRVRATDRGPGISATQLDAILGGQYRSRSGLGKGIVGVKRVANSFSIETTPGRGTTIVAEFRGRP
jgi:serine/threonine-protein kinase RsbT